MNLTSPISFSEADSWQSIPMRFRQVLHQLPPDHLAYVGADQQLTYQELAAASEGVANALFAILGTTAEREQQKAVALLLPHSAPSLIGIMGVLQAGHFFVPLDLMMGEATLQKIVLDCPPQAIITTAALHPHLAQLLPMEQNPPILCIETIAPVTPDPCAALPADPLLYASIQYTSGSTGGPRGVIRTHATHMNTSHLNYALCDTLPCDRVSHLFSYSLATSNASIFGALLNGATVYPHRLAEMTPLTLYQWVAEKQITQLSTSIGMLRGLAELSETHSPLPNLRIFSSGGDIMQQAEIEQLCRLLPADGKIVIRLSSTEAGAYAACVIEAGKPWNGEHTAIGSLPLNHQVTLVDEDQQPVEPGQRGEIKVQGRFLSAGYWNHPAETAAKFLPDPEDCLGQIFLTGDMGRMTADGRLEFLGRKDSLVKIRGFRIQLEEIEAALLAMESIQAAIVVAVEDGSGEKQLVAYLVCAGTPPTVNHVRTALLKSLPDYMLPSRFVMLDRLPLLANGKVDRKTLASPNNNGHWQRPTLDAPYQPARTPLEEKLVAIWQEVLGVQPIGVEDHFLDLGGNSLRAMQIHSRLLKQVATTLPIESLFQSDSIAELALQITQQQAAQLSQDELADLLSELESMVIDAPSIGASGRIFTP